jgi:hypothetical protein
MTRAMAGQTRDTRINHIRRTFEDLGPFVTGAALLFGVGLLFLFSAVQSPSMLQWTGTAVRAVENGGIAYYSFNGQTYTLDVTSPVKNPVTVYVDPAEPSTAMFSNPLFRWTDIASVGGPFTASVLLLTLGVARRSRRRHFKEHDLGVLYGTGLDSRTMSRLLERQRRTDS